MAGEIEIADVIKQIQELQDAITSGGVVDKKRLEQDLTELITQKVAAEVQEKLDAQPVRRTPLQLGKGKLIGADGKEITPANRYHRLLKDFAEGRPHRAGFAKVHPIDLWLTWHALRKSHLTRPAEAPAPSRDLEEAIKALTSTTPGTGDELVPYDMSEQLWNDFFLASRVAASLQTVTMPTNPFDIPLSLGAVTWRKGTQMTPTTTSDPATAKSTLTATELVTQQDWSYTMQEDAIAALMPGLRARLAQSGAEIIDDFAINADNQTAATGNVNSDDAAPAADSYYLSEGQNGMRRLAITDNAGQTFNAGGDALADTDLTAALSLMDKYAVDPTRLRMAVDVGTYLNGLLSTATGAPGNNVITIDRFGPGAVVQTGQLASYRGVPVLVSASMRETEADGRISAVTPANNTLGQILLYHVDMWYAGFMRDLLIEVDRDVKARAYVMVTSIRPAIAAWGARTTARHTAVIRNILN